MEKKELYELEVSEVLAALHTDKEGLTEKQVQKSREEYGENKLPEAKGRGYLRIFIDQFKSAVIYVLFGAALVVAVMGSITDATVIFIVLLINAVVGVYQEGKAENTLLALKKMTETVVTVFRAGKEVIVKDTELVVGDILVLREGDKIGADARIIQADQLVVDESILTGESIPVQKNSDVILKKVEIFDQTNMLFKGTNVIGGTALAVVASVGTQTYIGTVSKELSHLDTDVPLKRNIAELSKNIIYIVCVLCAFVFLVGIFEGISPKEMFMAVVALAVSAIPEGLPVTVTLILATGVHRMSKRNALVKKLQAVEALGQADVVATDKTGTLTYNQMQVERVWVDSTVFNVSGTGYEPTGVFTKNNIEIDPKLHAGLFLLAKQSAYVSGGTVAYDTEKNMWERIAGDPTEVAFNVLSQKVGFSRVHLLEEFPLVKEIPFSSASKYHATIHSLPGGGYNTAIVGAPESLLSQSTHVWRGEKVERIEAHVQEEIEKQIQAFSREGYRVLSVAYKETKGDNFESDLSGLVFVGLVAISDAIREEASESVRKAKKAGVKVVMITGDHKDTAEAIAARVSIFEKGDLIITGSELDTLPKERILEMLPRVSVFARVSPEHKSVIVDLYRSAGKIIAMTGDGVNDALSIAAADLGISMGKSGTEVAKEASDIVLLDDNFASIVSAIEEGRVIYRTIRKVVTYLLATNIGEILVVAGAIFLGFPLPISPSQIIWLNFVTDGFLVIALALEHHVGKAMEGKLKGSRTIINKEMMVRMGMVGIVMMVVGLYVYEAYVPLGSVYASTMTLTVLAVIQWFNAWSCRSEHVSIFKTSLFTNMYMWYATLSVVLLQYAALYYAPFQKLLGTTSITKEDWALVLILSCTVVIADEIRKVYMRVHSKITY